MSEVCLAGTDYVQPTTTLAAQTSNNTSAANSFTSQTNGNLGAGNVSKVDVHTLLYSGNNTKVYAHLMVWFGQSNHMNVGYSSTDPNEINSQVNDMVSRGIDGVIIDWYGPNNSKDQATQLVMAAAESHPGFTFAIAVDKGAISEYTCGGCSGQQALIDELQYVEQTYFTSPAYMTKNGVPVVTNFDIDNYYTIDWNAVNNALSTHPLFLFQNSGGFSHVLSDGSYAWVMPTQTDYGVSYLTNFYDVSFGYPGQQTVGATYKGFNDTLAAWGSNRIMSQQCGQTWLETFSEINGLYNSGKQLTDLQLVTWNDYEEGTEIESGISNCFSLTASASANGLNWKVQGNENTVDHYNVYISTDGQNLMSLTAPAAGIHSLNLCAFPMPVGTYQMFVQAVGKPSMANQITGAISYSPSCSGSSGGGGTTGGSSVTFTASPDTVTIPSGQSGTFNVTAKPQSGSFNGAITLSCSGVPSTLKCSFSPASITPGSGTGASTLTISAAAVTGMNHPERRKSVPIYAGLLLPFGLVGLAFSGNARRRGVQLCALFALVTLGMGAVSCGGSGAKSQSTAVSSAQSYSVTIMGNSSSSQISTTVNVIVQ
jgi:hypothetical protein